MGNKYNNKIEELISAEAAAACDDIEGFGGFVSVPLQFSFKSKEYSKGIAISSSENNLILDVFINVLLGYRIPQIAFSTQERIKNAINIYREGKNIKINIHVQGINTEENEKN